MENDWHHYVGPQEYRIPMWLADVAELIKKDDPDYTFEDEVFGVSDVGAIATHMEWQEPWCVYTAKGPSKNLSRLADE